jgi:hypothetical protein
MGYGFQGQGQARFQRMLERIRTRGPIDEANLRSRLESDAVVVKAQAERAFIMPFLPGPGRLDALGSIHNSLAAIKTGIPENTRPTLAPVKPPFLWNAPQSAWVQWSGIADNPLPRNVGETLGVFARYDLKSATPSEGLFESTTDVKGLIDLERLLRADGRGSIHRWSRGEQQLSRRSWRNSNTAGTS